MSKVNLIALNEDDEREEQMKYELVAKETNMIEMILTILALDHGIGDEVD